MYQIAYAQSARRALKRLRHGYSFPEENLKEIVTLLMYGKTLPILFKDHQLHGEFAHLRECHLGFNLLLLYKRNEDLRVVTIANIGTHPELFGE
jgi:mRNA interferase YafQ